MREQLKTLGLTFLVLLSFLLSLGIWSSTPQYESVDAPQFSSTVITDPSHQRTLGEVTKPRSLILHFGKDQHTVVFPGQSGYEQGMNVLNQANFFDLRLESEFGEAQWQQLIKEEQGLEIDFGTDMPASILDTAEVLKFTSRYDPTMHVKTLYLFKGQAGEADLHALFYGSGEGKMYSARVILPKEPYAALFDSLPEAIPYQMFGQSLHRHFYLPQGRIKVPQYAVELTEPEQGKREMEAFFVDQSLIRQVLVRDGSEILTDGIRVVESKDNIITYRNITPSSQLIRKTEVDVGISKALSFANEHGGFLMEPIVLYEPALSRNSKGEGHVFQFRPYVGGTPLIDPFALVYVSLIDSEVAKMQRPQITIGSKPYQGKAQQELMSGSQLMTRVENSVFDRNRITDAYLAYLLEGKGQDDYANLRPVWVIEQKGEWGSGIFDAITGEELHDKEVLIGGLE